jgi:hypothetical protein
VVCIRPSTKAKHIDTSDYLFNDAYIRMLEKNDEAAAQKLNKSK